MTWTLPSITITASSGARATFADAFRYIAPPVITQLSILTGPTAGGKKVPIAGGETLQLEGTNFKEGLTVTVDGFPVAATRVDDTHVTFVVSPSTTERSADVRLTNEEGLSSLLTGGVAGVSCLIFSQMASTCSLFKFS